MEGRDSDQPCGCKSILFVWCGVKMLFVAVYTCEFA